MLHILVVLVATLLDLQGRLPLLVLVEGHDVHRIPPHDRLLHEEDPHVPGDALEKGQPHIEGVHAAALVDRVAQVGDVLRRGELGGRQVGHAADDLLVDDLAH